MKSEGTGAGLNFLSPLARRGGKEAFATRLSSAQNMGGGGFESAPFLARRVREEVSISLPLSGRKGEEEGSPVFFCLMGKGQHVERKPL